MEKAVYKYIFNVFAMFFGIAAIYHCAGFIKPSLVPYSPHWRHGLFIVINITGIWLMLSRPSWLVFPFVAITIQQIYSHGRRIIEWANNNKIDWISIAVIVLLPTILAMIIHEQKQKNVNNKNKKRLNQDQPALPLRQAGGRD